MSYILDALKKIEHEKNRKNRPDGKINLAGDLFHERLPVRAAGSKWKFVAGGVVVTVIVAATAWFVLRPGVKKTASIPPQTAQAVVPAVVPIATPVVPIQSQLQSQTMPLPQVQAPVAASALPAAATSAVPAGNTNVADEESGERRNRRQAHRQSRPAAAAVVTPVTKQVAQTIQAPADIKLSGIAWQDDRQMRRAVVNGFLLKEGVLVSGAKIAEIRQDKVRFTTSGGSFELRLDGAVPADVKR